MSRWLSEKNTVLLSVPTCITLCKTRILKDLTAQWKKSYANPMQNAEKTKFNIFYKFRCKIPKILQRFFIWLNPSMQIRKIHFKQAKKWRNTLKVLRRQYYAYMCINATVLYYKCKTLSFISCVLPWFQNCVPIYPQVRLATFIFA